MKKNEVVVIIPALDPNEDIMESFISKLKKEFSQIVIVNDGSNVSHDNFFKKFEKDGLVVLRNYINYGKGRSLKYACNYILNNYPDIKAIVTADCDGQHSVKDIIKVAKATIENKDSYVLGVRDFDDKNVPFKSKFGNRITRSIFRLFIGLKITDTQTGLRGMSKKVATDFLSTPGERYEYESNTLIECRDKNIPIKEVVIDTIYIDNNSESHFNPIKDSIRIYKQFIKYIIASVSSFVLDIALFSLFYKIFNKQIVKPILFATIVSRVISSLYNYFVNSKVVFKRADKSSIIKYFILVVFQMFASALLVELLVKTILKFNPTIVKMIVDTVIFIVNYFVQREWVFKKKNS